MDHFFTTQLLEALKNPDEQIRQNATGELWRMWFYQKGNLGVELLRRAQFLVEIGVGDQAEQVLSEIINNHPDFAEAWNRRAILYYRQENYFKSKPDCQQVLRLNPVHFGAWHGLGLCHAALGEYSEAINAFQKALDIQPYATVNQKLILECTLRLN